MTEKPPSYILKIEETTEMLSTSVGRNAEATEILSSSVGSILGLSGFIPKIFSEVDAKKKAPEVR